MLIDALGWTYLEGRQFLSHLLPYRRPLRTVLGYSSGAIPSILTGALPSVNGHWNLFYYDPKNSPFRWLRPLRRLPAPLVNHRLTRKLLKEMGRHVLGLGPLFECSVSPSLLPWFDWVEKKNIYDRGGICGAPSVFDQLAANGISYRAYSYHSRSDKEILAQARRDIVAGEASFYFLYLSELDHFLHMHCKNAEQVGRRLDEYERRLGELFELALRRFPRAEIAVFSDHGMTPVDEHYDLMQKIEFLPLSMPDDYLAVYDSTMARFWFSSERAQREVVQQLERVPCGRILREPELRELGVFFPDCRYGELIFLMNPGWLLARSDFHGSWMPVGMHGYHPDDPYSDAIFLGNRQPAGELHSILGMHEFMCTSAGIEE